MAFLYDNSKNIGIEVADNILHLFMPANQNSKPEERQKIYTTMLEVSLWAFKELKL